MRSGPFIITLNAVVSGSNEEIDLLSNQEMNFIKKKKKNSCWVYGGLLKELSIPNL